MQVSRRTFLAGTGAAALAAVAGGLRAQSAQLQELRPRLTSYQFDRPVTKGIASTRDNAPPPVLRLRQGQRQVLRLTNGLDDYTTMHWHGIRLQNQMDGVPYLTQMPIAPGESFDYDFIPPDAGTYWYHPHCRTMEQMAHGLTGMLIVEEAEDAGFDLEIALNLKDFRLNDDGTLLPFFTPRGAARAGTLGNVMTANWQIEPNYDVPAGGLVRLRILNTDTTRIHKLVLPQLGDPEDKGSLQGKVIAWDGHPLNEALPWPDAANPLVMGPGQRADIAIRVPDSEGVELALTSIVADKPKNLAQFKVIGTTLARNIAELSPLAANPVSQFDVSSAQTHRLLLGWSPDGNGVNNGLCGDYPFTFWSINRNPWPGDAVEGTGPIVTLNYGQSYILRLQNESPDMHPIHLHGLSFIPLQSNARHIARNWTDTILLMKGETIDIALKADNLGDWALHCHVIEHQKTGLSGFIRVV